MLPPFENHEAAELLANLTICREVDEIVYVCCAR
jgi:hypothetical protein